MRFEFQKKSGNIRIINHIVEHEGEGTLHKLVLPLQMEDNQKVFFTYNMPTFKFNDRDYYIIHTTGHMYPIIKNLEKLSKNNIKYFLFLHVAPRYYEFKKEKKIFLDYLSYIQKKYKISIFSPSKNVAKQYMKMGIETNYIQLGINRINEQVRNRNLEMYYNKYVTVCTSSDFRYMAIKGIDIFANYIQKINKKDEALILGFNGEYMGIRCRKVNSDDFLNILAHSKIYLQFSRTEAYNLTAVQAKQLKIPILVSKVDGHIDCIEFEENLYDENDLLSQKIKEIQKENIIIRNFENSIVRESMKSFIESVIKKMEVFCYEKNNIITK